MKLCSKCGLKKSTQQFYKTDKTKSGLRGECKDCSHIYSRQGYLKRKLKKGTKKCKWCEQLVKENRYKFCSNRCARKYKLQNPKNHHNWQGGKSKKKYPHEFDEVLKEKIRKKFNYICQNCGRTQEEELKEFNRKLAVNHLDHNKNNCDENNLNILCGRCNIKYG